jgi:transcription elongation factor Elf1
MMVKFKDIYQNKLGLNKYFHIIDDMKRKKQVIRQKIYHCPRCDVKFSSQFDMYEHLFENHRDFFNHVFRTRNIYECFVCGLNTDMENKPKRLMINHIIKDNHYENFPES